MRKIMYFIFANKLIDFSCCLFPVFGNASLYGVQYQKNFPSVHFYKILKLIHLRCTHRIPQSSIKIAIQDRSLLHNEEEEMSTANILNTLVRCGKFRQLPSWYFPKLDSVSRRSNHPLSVIRQDKDRCIYCDL